MSAVVYRTYILPVLMFVAQLRTPPASWHEVESAAFGALVAGPGGRKNPWITREDLHHLKGFYGLPCSFESLEAAARAGLLG